MKPRASAGTTADRPAFYALSLGGWRDYLTLLHPPYTLWHLSYVVLGAALSPDLHYDRLGATLLAFFLALGISAHALDELNGRPLQTRIPDLVLIGLAVFGLATAIALGLAQVVMGSHWLLGFIAFGAFILPAYNLEWFRGRLHSDPWFAVSWGTFPFLTAYWVSAERFGLSALFGALAVFLVSLVQRTLSRRVRTIRRRVRSMEGEIIYNSGTADQIDRAWALEADERALSLMAVAMVLLSVATLALR